MYIKKNILLHVFRCRRFLGVNQSYSNKVSTQWWTWQYIHVLYWIKYDDLVMFCATSSSTKDWFCAILHNAMSRKKSNHVRTNGGCRPGMCVIVNRNLFRSKFHWQILREGNRKLSEYIQLFSKLFKINYWCKIKNSQLIICIFFLIKYYRWIHWIK